MRFILKYLDKFLKVIKTDRTTFITYVLTLVTAYIVIDRFMELIIIWSTGMSVSYWGPIRYSLALLVPWFAFFTSFASKFVQGNENAKITFFYTYMIAMYIIGVSLFIQVFNRTGWVLILSLPNYNEIITEFSHLIRPAFTSLALYLPMVTFFPFVRWMYVKINDPIFPNTFLDSITDYQGVDLNPSNAATGPYSMEITVCTDRGSGKPVKILDDRRFQGTVIVGPTGVRKN